jgi:hypothetical protein
MRSTPSVGLVDDLPHLAVASETLAAVHALRSASDRFLPRNVALPDPRQSAIMVSGLGAGDTSPAPPPGDFLDRLRRDLVAASRAGRIESVPRQELRYAPWLLWNGDPPGASLEGLLTLLLDHARTSSAMLRRLIQAYLRDFDPRAPGIGEAATYIRQMLPNSKARFDSWRTAHAEVHLFDPARGPEHVAIKLLTGEPPEEVLARYRLDDATPTRRCTTCARSWEN